MTTATKEDMDMITKIATRAEAIYRAAGIRTRRKDIAVGLHFVHTEIIRMRLKDMLEGDDENLMHDVAGIDRHINVRLCRFDDCFCPRYADLRAE